MEIMKRFILLITLSVCLVLLIGCGTDTGSGTSSGVATIKGQFKLEANGSWNNISVLISGKTVSTTSTDVSGNFSAVVDCGSYTISAGKAGYDTANATVSAATNGSTYDIGTHYLGSQSPPGTPSGYN